MFETELRKDDSQRQCVFLVLLYRSVFPCSPCYFLSLLFFFFGRGDCRPLNSEEKSLVTLLSNLVMRMPSCIVERPAMVSLNTSLLEARIQTLLWSASAMNLLNSFGMFALQSSFGG